MAIVVFQFTVFIVSVIIHEIAHGAVAYWLGDETAYRMGRLTMNPVSHIDPFGSIILPLILSVPLLFGVQPIIVGWAKPVPYDPRNLKNPKSGSGIIAWAGPASNLAIASIFALFVAFFAVNPLILAAFHYIILINLMLAVFNLVPIPPLDGSKIMAALLPYRSPIVTFIEHNAFILLIGFLFFGLSAVQAIVKVLFWLLTSAGAL
jgi:Zn-dependent protease